MSLANAAMLARDEVFRDRVLVAVCSAARTVLADPPTTPNRTFRMGYARSVLNDPLSYQDSFAWVLASDPVLHEFAGADSIPELTLMTRVKATWDALIMPMA